MKRTVNHLIDTNPKRELKELSINDMLMIRGGGKISDDGEKVG